MQCMIIHSLQLNIKQITFSSKILCTCSTSTPLPMNLVEVSAESPSRLSLTFDLLDLHFPDDHLSACLEFSHCRSSFNDTEYGTLINAPSAILNLIPIYWSLITLVETCLSRSCSFLSIDITKLPQTLTDWTEQRALKITNLNNTYTWIASYPGKCYWQPCLPDCRS